MDGVKAEMPKLEEFLRKSLEWTRYLLVLFLISVLVIVLVYNVFAHKENGVPDHVVETLRKGLNLVTLIDNGGIAGIPFPFRKIIFHKRSHLAEHNMEWLYEFCYDTQDHSLP